MTRRYHSHTSPAQVALTSHLASLTPEDSPLGALPGTITETWATRPKIPAGPLTTPLTGYRVGPKAGAKTSAKLPKTHLDPRCGSIRGSANLGHVQVRVDAIDEKTMCTKCGHHRPLEVKTWSGYVNRVRRARQGARQAIAELQTHGSGNTLGHVRELRGYHSDLLALHTEVAALGRESDTTNLSPHQRAEKARIRTILLKAISPQAIAQMAELAETEAAAVGALAHSLTELVSSLDEASIQRLSLATGLARAKTSAAGTGKDTLLLSALPGAHVLGADTDWKGTLQIEVEAAAAGIAHVRVTGSLEGIDETVRTFLEEAVSSAPESLEQLPRESTLEPSAFRYASGAYDLSGYQQAVFTKARTETIQALSQHVNTELRTLAAGTARDTAARAPRLILCETWRIGSQQDPVLESVSEALLRFEVRAETTGYQVLAVDGLVATWLGALLPAGVVDLGQIATRPLLGSREVIQTALTLATESEESVMESFAECLAVAIDTFA